MAEHGELIEADQHRRSRCRLLALHRIEELIDENTQPPIAEAHAAGGKTQVNAHSPALQVHEIEVMSCKHPAHGGVIEELGMAANRGEHARALIRSLFVEVTRRAFERACEVFCL